MKKIFLTLLLSALPVVANAYVDKSSAVVRILNKDAGKVSEHTISVGNALNFEKLNNYDAEVYASVEKELKRQQENIELIASENIVSEAVLDDVDFSSLTSLQNKSIFNVKNSRVNFDMKLDIVNDNFNFKEEHL